MMLPARFQLVMAMGRPAMRVVLVGGRRLRRRDVRVGAVDGAGCACGLCARGVAGGVRCGGRACGAHVGDAADCGMACGACD